jgi:hypothetical protein
MGGQWDAYGRLSEEVFMAVEYEVIQHFQKIGIFGSSYNTDDFTGSVETYLKDGWKLAGGVSVVQDSDGDLIYYQAVYRES